MYLRRSFWGALAAAYCNFQVSVDDVAGMDAWHAQESIRTSPVWYVFTKLSAACDIVKASFIAPERAAWYSNV